MPLALQDVLGRAYDLAQAQGQEAAAVQMIKDALATEPALSQQASDERDRLAQVVSAREMGGQHGDHVSMVLSRVLTKALAKGEQS